MMSETPRIKGDARRVASAAAWQRRTCCSYSWTLEGGKFAARARRNASSAVRRARWYSPLT